MSVIRQQNWLSQQRVDLPHLRAIESGIAADFDVLAGRGIGGDRPLVIRGFVLTGIASLVPATSLQLAVADSILFNVEADESGTFLWLPSDAAVETLNPATNSKVIGSWTPGALNYVGIEFVREADDTTTDLVQFLDPNTLLETGRQVPLARTLGFRIVISTLPFSAQPNLIPIAKVTLNSSQVSAVEDARPMLFRLGSGGDTPSGSYKYAWPDGRAETLTLGNGLFVGGDKAISSQKDWGDSIMTRLWEVGGGQYWYSATADRNVQMVTYGSPFSGLVAPTVGDGEYFSWNSVSSTVGWQNIRFLFDNTTGWFNDVAAGSVVIADGEAIYVDLQRGSNATGLVVQKAPLVSVGSGDPPGSRWIMAYRKGSEIFTRGWRYPVGTTFQPATTTSMGMVKLNQTPEAPLAPVVVSIMSGGRIAVTATADGVAATFTGLGTGGSGLIGQSGTTFAVANGGVKGLGGNTATIGNAGVYGQGGTGTANGGGYGGIFIGGAGTGGGPNGGGGGVTGIGAAGTGGGTDGSGGLFTGGGTTGHGLEGFGTGTGRGAVFTSGDGVGSSAIATICQTVAGTGLTAVVALGGDSTAAAGGLGLFAAGGDGGGVNQNGGNGISTFGGDRIGSGVSGWGISATGGSANGGGVLGTGTGTGVGVRAIGGTTGAGGQGLIAIGGGSSDGITSTGSTGGSRGGLFTGTTTFEGLRGEGGPTDGVGVVGHGNGNGRGGVFSASGSGRAADFLSGSGGGIGILVQRGDSVTSSVAIQCDGSIDLSSASDVADTTAIHNRISPALIPKAFGRFRTIVGGTTVTPDQRVNVTSITQAATYIEVVLAQAFSGTDYHVTATYLGSSDTVQNVAYTNITANNTFRIYPYSGNSGAVLTFQDPTSAVRTFSFACFGKQA